MSPCGGEGAGPVEAAGGQAWSTADGQGRPGGDRSSSARKSTALRVWLPVIVPPAKTTVEVPGSSVPAVYVQLWLVRIVPARVSVPDGLLMTTGAGRPTAVVDGAGERLGAGPVDQQGAGPAVESRGLADRRPGRRACRSVEVPRSGSACRSTVRVVPAGDRCASPGSRRVEGVAAGDRRPPAKTTVEVPGSTVPAVYVQLCASGSCRPG